jgi:hypothetical protein
MTKLREYKILAIHTVLEIFRDYHDTKITSSEFLKKHCLEIDALDNSFLRILAENAIRDLKEI